MSQASISRIVENRLDMTEWVLHFVHDRTYDNYPGDDVLQYEDYHGYPYHEDVHKNDRFSYWQYTDELNPIESDASAFGVLHRILTDGHIRATWAFRKGRPTIYGPRAAVCLTEMPLYALVDYAKRRPQKAVDCYAIGVLKSELFAAGGRPVIYGLSGRHEEKDSGGRVWPRKLADKCGLPEYEQYRYVATSLGSDWRIDWSHEREWRWVDQDDECYCPGVPIWLDDEPQFFSKAFVVVPRADEAERILNLLKQLHDSRVMNSA